jgi:hypothetical protein
MFTDTALDLFAWLQMEDIYSNIFILKCNRYNEKVQSFLQIFGFDLIYQLIVIDTFISRNTRLHAVRNDEPS